MFGASKASPGTINLSTALTRKNDDNNELLGEQSIYQVGTCTTSAHVSTENAKDIQEVGKQFGCRLHKQEQQPAHIAEGAWNRSKAAFYSPGVRVSC